MAKKRGLSIRYKILLFLTIIPLVTLGTYLVMAISIFESDKVAYVFESSSAVAKTLSAQASTDLNSVLNTAKPLLQDYLSAGQFGPVSRTILNSDSILDWVAVFDIKNGEVGNQATALIERLNGLGQRDIGAFPDLKSVLREALTQGRVLKVPFRDERVLILERVGELQSVNSKVFMMLGRLAGLSQSFKNPMGVEAFLVNSAGGVLMGPNDFDKNTLEEKVPIKFLEQSKGEKQFDGTEEIETEMGRKYLVSYSKTSFGDIMVVSLVDRRAALSAVQVLIRKSIVFFLLLISSTTVVSLIASGNLTAALRDLFKATKIVAQGQFNIRVEKQSNDEIGSLAESFNVMAAEVSRLMMETAEKARMETELKTAQTVQETLFPAPVCDLAAMKIAGHFEPASECGGDWWHYCEVNKKVYLWIGDATGHGAPAALITSAAKSAATIIERLNVEPDHALTLLNRAIFDVSKGKIMMTFFLACYDPETSQLTYSNASHEGPYLIPGGKEDIDKSDLVPLNDVNNPRLGQAKDTIYKQVSVKVNPGDRLFFYTDGLFDVKDPSQKFWGERKFLKAFVKANQGKPDVEQTVNAIKEDVAGYRQGEALIDDVTFFMAQVK